MKKPFKYFVLCDITKDVLYETNVEPLLHHLQSYVETDDDKVKMLKQTKTAYIDTRYEAKLRLYNYITFKRKVLEIPKYNPYKNTDIGKSIGILS